MPHFITASGVTLCFLTVWALQLFPKQRSNNTQHLQTEIDLIWEGGGMKGLILTANAKHLLVTAHDNQKCYFPFPMSYTAIHVQYRGGSFILTRLQFSVTFHMLSLPLKDSAAGFSNCFSSLNYIKLGASLFPVQALCRSREVLSVSIILFTLGSKQLT